MSARNESERNGDEPNQRFTSFGEMVLSTIEMKVPLPGSSAANFSRSPRGPRHSLAPRLSRAALGMSANVVDFFLDRQVVEVLDRQA